ncbi:non-reducing polyketide synthase pyr2 [Aspergillus brasiliensis]|uniref:Non-reducing polyketide synthase pyr2 n=1 Tax=Aspergillus brasiliensis TaxID=319629 RepID=A0A9W5Z199_9EURO|nr:non-reducing polyketide synthase pyr2 [Aspergillus brasiliensis]GKZ49703.1 non-reducing polyketide synthase pyr2 [Aspergillus brasiliensis]
MPPESIAIIGSGRRFPGQADSPAKLWGLLSKPRDVLREIPADRYNAAAGFYHPDGLHHGSSSGSRASGPSTGPSTGSGTGPGLYLA